MKELKNALIIKAIIIFSLPMASYGSLEEHYQNNPSIEKAYQGVTKDYLHALDVEVADQVSRFQWGSKQELLNEDFLYTNQLEQLNIKRSGTSTGRIVKEKETDIIWFLKTGQFPYKHYFTAKLLELLLGSDRIPVAKLMVDEPDWVASRLLQNFIIRKGVTEEIRAAIASDPLLNMCLNYLAVGDFNEGNVGYVFIEGQRVETAIDFDYSLGFPSESTPYPLLFQLLDGEPLSYQTLSQERVLETLKAFLAIPEEQVEAAIIQLMRNIEKASKKTIEETLGSPPLIIYLRLMTSRIKLRWLKNLVESLKAIPDLTEKQKDWLMKPLLERTLTSQAINNLLASIKNNAHLTKFVNNPYEDGEQIKELLNDLDKKDILSVQELLRQVRLGMINKSFLEGINKFIIEKKADVNTKDCNGNSALLISAELSEWSLVEFLIEKGADINIQNNLGNSALLIAAKLREWSFVKFLIEKGADINIQNNLGNSVLLIAAKLGEWSIVEFLIEKGANVNIQNKLGDSILLIAAELGESSLIDLLIKKGVDVDSNLLLAVKSAQWPLVKFLIEKGIDVNAKDYHGNSALLIAAELGEWSIVELLIEKGADVSAKDYHGNSILLIAAELGKWSLVKRLIEEGVDVNTQNQLDNSVLLIAAKLGEWSIIEFLIDKGADVNMQNMKDETALMIATRKGNKAIIHLLEKHSKLKMNSENQEPIQ